MAALANSLLCPRDSISQRFHGGSAKLLDQSSLSCKPKNFLLRPMHNLTKTAVSKRVISVRAISSCSDAGRPSNASIFVGGFLLGGIVVGTLGCIYAPKITEALSGADKKELMRKLPKFIYDEGKALEKTRKLLEDKIAQLNSQIDGVSFKLQGDGDSNGTVNASDEIEAAI